MNRTSDQEACCSVQTRIYHVQISIALNGYISNADLSQVRVHDLKHTFGRRLRAAGVSFEDRQDLLGHRSGRITTHYSSAELQNLFEAGNRVCEKQKSGVVLTLLRNSNFKSRQVVNEGVKAISL